MSVPCRKCVFIVDAKAFRRARVESFLTPWAHNEQVELISLDPGEAHARLVERSQCDMLIYSIGATTALELFTEIQLLHTLRRAAALAIVSDEEGPATIIAAIRSGAQGYLSNSMPPDLALQALSFVLHGGTYFPPTAIMAGRMPPIDPGLPDMAPEQILPDLGPQHQPSVPGQEEVLYAQQTSLFEGKGPATHHVADPPDSLRPTAGFTERQYAVLVCLSQGLPNKVIGRKLGMTETTVKVHVREIMRKLGVCNRTQVAIAAGRGGVVAEAVGLVPADPQPLMAKSTVQ
jgi:DNA-binding NarL/FixJ family response regulator